MRIRKGRYFLSRVVKINLSQENLIDAICNPAIIKVGKYNWTITDMIDKRDDESLPFIYGRLVKYADDTQDVVDEYNHTQDQSMTANLVKASSPFVYLPRFSGLCFLHVYNGIESKIVWGENINQTAQFVSTGNAQVGFVALSTILASEMKGKQGKYYILTNEECTPIAQAGVVIKDKNTVLAQAFLDYLLSDKAKPIWKKHGYELK